MKQLGVGSVVLLVALLVTSGCAAAPVSSGSVTSTASVPSATTSTEVTGPESIIKKPFPTGDGSPKRRIEAGCARSTSFLAQVKDAIDGGDSIVTGKVTPTATVTTLAGSNDDTPFTQVRLESIKVLHGPPIAPSVSALTIGGNSGGIVTELAPSVQSAWSTTGLFFGLIVKQNGQYVLQTTLPIVNDAVVIPPIGCWQQPTKLTTSVVGQEAEVFDGSKVRVAGGQWPSISIAAIRGLAASAVTVKPSG